MSRASPGRKKSGPAYTDVTQVAEKAQIARRAAVKDPVWYLHKLGDDWPRLSLRTTDKKVAVDKAMQMYMAWHKDPKSDWRAVGGITTHLVSFKQVAEEWLATQTTDKVNKTRIVNTLLVPFFDGKRKLHDIHAISDALVDDYKAWRRTQRFDGKAKKAADGLSGKTLNREYPTLRQIFDFAARQGYLPKGSIPDVKAERAKPNRRPALLGDDFDTLFAGAEKWIAEAEDDKHRMRRQLLADWIYIGRHTGIRLPHEGDRLTWNDVRFDTPTLYVPNETKTDKRQVRLTDGCIDRLKKMKARRVANLAKSRKKLDDGELIFVLEDGSSQPGMAKLFGTLVTRCKFPPRAGEESYTPYSLRHTYATFKLAEGELEYVVAQSMGTSPKMLHEHYAHSVIEQTRDYLKKKGLLPAPAVPPASMPVPNSADVERARAMVMAIVPADQLPPDHPGRLMLTVVQPPKSNRG